MAFNDYTTNLNLFNDYSKKVNIVQLIKIKIFVNIEEIEYIKTTIVNGFGTYDVYKFTENNYIINREEIKPSRKEDIDYLIKVITKSNQNIVHLEEITSDTDIDGSLQGVFIDTDNKINYYIKNTVTNPDKIYIRLQINITNDTKINYLYDKTQFGNVSPYIDEYYNYDEIFLPYLLNFANVSRTLTFDIDQLGNNSPVNFSILNKDGLFDYILGDSLLDESHVQVYLKNLNDSNFNVVIANHPIEQTITDYFNITGNGLRLISEGLISEVDERLNEFNITILNRLLIDKNSDLNRYLIFVDRYYQQYSKKENQNFVDRIIPAILGPRTKYNLVEKDEISGFKRGLINFDSMYSFIIDDYDENITTSTNRDNLLCYRPYYTERATGLFNFVSITSVDNSLSDFTILTIPLLTQDSLDQSPFVEGGSYIIRDSSNSIVTTARLHKISLSGYVFEKNLLISTTNRIFFYENTIPIVCIKDSDGEVFQLINQVDYRVEVLEDFGSRFEYFGIKLANNFEASYPTIAIYDPNIHEIKGVCHSYSNNQSARNFLFENDDYTDLGSLFDEFYKRKTGYEPVLSSYVNKQKLGFQFINIDESNYNELSGYTNFINKLASSIFCFIDLSCGGYIRALNINRNINLSYLFNLKINEDLILSNINKKIISPESSKIKLINQYKNEYQKFSASFFEFEESNSNAINHKEENIITDFESYIKEDDKIYKGFPVINDSIYFFFYLVYKTSKRTYYTIELPLIFADVNLGQTVEVQRKLIKRSETDSLVYEKLIVTGIEYQAEKIILTCLDYPKNYEVQLS